MTPAPLRTNRRLLKLVLLNLVTFGIYGIVLFSGISSDINTIASRFDGRKTMHYCLLRFWWLPSHWASAHWFGTTGCATALMMNCAAAALLTVSVPAHFGVGIFSAHCCC